MLSDNAVALAKPVPAERHWRCWIIVPALFVTGCTNTVIDLTPEGDAACETDDRCDDGDESDVADDDEG
jgi:hypothetical protein